MTLLASTFNDTYFAASSAWLTDPETLYLIDSPAVADDKRLAWYQSLPSRKDYLIRGIEADGEPIGAFGLKNINYDDASAEYFGYIGVKSFRGRGIGHWMMDAAKNQAAELGLERMYLKVITPNYKAVNLYFKTGFTITAHENGVYVMTMMLENNK